MVENSSQDKVEDPSSTSPRASESRFSTSFGVLAPPFNPPSVRFNPPLSIQRRVKVHELLKQASKNYENPIQSLLEVGCGGDTPFMQSLLSCDDDLPLSILSGIDIDERLASVGIETAFTSCEYGDDDRWRDLTVSLVHGSFEDISLQNIGPFDAITSSEVIEHLNAGPLANFAPVLLGRMNPKILIVTTPNRDFNSLFEMPYEAIEEPSNKEPYIWDPLKDPALAGRRFYREPHKYAMRHDDHRFEWTRAEFRTWGDEAAERFSYSVSYYGCGALYDGAEIRGVGWRVEDALRKHINNSEGQTTVDPENGKLTQELLLQAYGHCSQVAVFTRNDLKKKSRAAKESLEERLHTRTLTDMQVLIDNHINHMQNLQQRPAGAATVPNSGSLPLHPPLRLVKYHTFVKRSEAQAMSYPPTLRDLFEGQRLTLKHLLPIEIQRVWQYQNAMAEYRAYDYPAVVIQTDIKTLWDASHSVRRACRYHISVLEHLMATARDNTAEFRLSRQKGNGQLKLDFYENDGCRGGMITIDLEQIKEYSRYSGPKPVSTTPVITAKVYWSMDAGAANVPKSTYLPQGLPADRLLILDQPVETMLELRRDQEMRGRADERSRPEKETDVHFPVILVYLRPNEWKSNQKIPSRETDMGWRLSTSKNHEEPKQAEWDVIEGGDTWAPTDDWSSW